MVHKALEHGGNLDHHIDLFGGEKSNWIDLSTGINNSPYPIPKIPKCVWMSLPDKTLTESFQTIARDFWKVPKNAHIIAANGTSAIISLLPSIFKKGSVDIYHPSYNEYEAAFLRNGWKISNTDPEARILVNPNNPDGKYWNSKDILSSGKLTIIDESFCDLTPNKSLIEFSDQPGVIILKSFGKFWGLAGLRLGCAIASSETLRNLENALGPWPASGPALYLASMALQNKTWAQSTIENLNNFAVQLDDILEKSGISIIGGTSLFRLIEISDAEKLKIHFARNHVLIRTFPYSNKIARIGVPSKNHDRLKLKTILSEFKQ